MYINFDDSVHSCVLGTTGTGKTFGAAHSLAKSKKGVIFFNTLGTDSVPSEGYTRADANTDLDIINRLLDKGRKVNFIPSEDVDLRNAQLFGLIRYFLVRKRSKDFIFAIDEVHTFSNDKTYKTKNEIIRLATTGRNYGVKGVYISQRPANVENQVLEMCSQWVCYMTPMSSGWFNQYGLPGDEIIKRLGDAPQYSYVVYRMPKELKGAFRVTV